MTRMHELKERTLSYTFSMWNVHTLNIWNVEKVKRYHVISSYNEPKINKHYLSCSLFVYSFWKGVVEFLGLGDHRIHTQREQLWC